MAKRKPPTTTCADCGADTPLTVPGTNWPREGHEREVTCESCENVRDLIATGRLDADLYDRARALRARYGLAGVGLDHCRLCFSTDVERLGWYLPNADERVSDSYGDDARCNECEAEDEVTWGLPEVLELVQCEDPGKRIAEWEELLPITRSVTERNRETAWEGWDPSALLVQVRPHCDGG